jgi:NTP pyrophosphatase (non-canonical NTP hydrolase)
MAFDTVQNDAEAERLAILMEEMGEALQAMGKVIRHGWLSVDPTKKPEDQTTNQDDLTRELGHVMAALEIVAQAGDVSGKAVALSGRAKLQGIRRWMHCAENIEAADKALAAITVYVKRQDRT